MEALAAASGGQSPLLRCLSQLNDDVLAAFLLPKIMQQGSAGSVALTCSQLRRLCQSSTQHLDLSTQPLQDSPCNNPALAQQLIAAFPQCTSLKVAWHSSSLDRVHHHISTLLKGLPGLETIITNIIVEAATPKTNLRPVLKHLHAHAAGLRCLHLQLDRAWQHDTDWAALGNMVKLTRLELAFDSHVEFPCTQHDLQRLSSLTKLQAFTIKAPVAYWADPFDDTRQPPAAQQFPTCLTSLTQLVLPFEVVWDISSICECISLCDLQLRLAEDPSARRKDWPVQDWGALGKLSRLTHLHIGINHPGSAESDAFYSVISQLKGLRSVGANCWAADALPVLQSLTQVTAVHGAWKHMPADLDVCKLSCPHVKELGDAKDPPFQAFPNLVCVTFSLLSYTSLRDVSCFCTALQKLALTKCADVEMRSWRENFSEVERLSVFRALANMQHLTHLELSFSSDTELIAFTVAAAAVSTPKLRCLHVHGHMTAVSLVQLQSMRGLVELTVHMSSSRNIMDTFYGVVMNLLLVGLAALPKVCLVLPWQTQQGKVATVRQWAARLGLPLPEIVQISVAEDG